MKRKQAPLFVVLLCDILLAGLILAVFAFFLLALPAIRGRGAVSASTQASYEPTEQAENVIEPEESRNDTEESQSEPEVPEETETTDNRTPWQIRFEDKFSSETEITDCSYRSPTVSVTVETIAMENGRGQPVVYHVADVYIADMSCFVTWTANNELKYFSVQDVDTMDTDAEAILSVSGDFYCYQSRGFLMRNSQLYMNDAAYCDICVLFEDGTMGCYSRGSYTNEEIIAAGAVQIWNFGPTLLDADGKAKEYFDVSSTVAMVNPRSAIGYYEPGHYCFIVADGRQEASVGMTLPELAAAFEELGCTAAYNLDGGGSAVMLINHQRVSVQSNGADRALGDILVIKESGAVK